MSIIMTRIKRTITKTKEPMTSISNAIGLSYY